MSTQHSDHPLAAGDRLPNLSFAAVPESGPVSLRTRRRLATVVVLLHGADCDGCRSYLKDLADEHNALRKWDGRVLPVLPEELKAAGRVHSEGRFPFPILADPEGKCAGRFANHDAAVLIADQWGEVYFVKVAGRAHRFPSAPEVADWLRFLAIQCPECEGEAR